MEIDLARLTAKQIYFTMTQTLIPRPVAWVLSENLNGDLNLAPYSYFTAVSSAPPLILISAGKKPDGTPKDTRVNIEQRRDFVVHIAHQALLEPLNESSATLPPGVSEVEQLGLETAPFLGSRLPRLACCRVAFACELHQVQEIGDTPQALIFGRVKVVFVDDDVTGQDDKGRLKVHADRLDPIGRLGASEYATLGQIHQLVRPA